MPKDNREESGGKNEKMSGECEEANAAALFINGKQTTENIYSPENIQHQQNEEKETLQT